MYTFRYEDKRTEDLISTDLQHEYAALLGEQQATAQAYKVYIFKFDRVEPETAEVLYLPSDQRIGIAWGAQGTWADSTGDLERDIDMWLNNPDEWEARN